MFFYKGGKKLWRAAVGRKNAETDLPKTDSNGKGIDINYFRTRRDWFMKTTAILANALGGACIAVFVYLFAQFSDELTTRNTALSWQGWIALMALTCVILGAFTGLATCLCEWSAERQLLNIRAKFLHEVLRQDIGYFDAYDATALSSKLVENTRCVRNLIGIKCAMAYMYIGIIIACIRQAFTMNWQVAAISFCVVPVVVLAGWWAGRIEYKANRQVTKSNEEADSVALESLESIRTVKAFNLHDVMKARYKESIDMAATTAEKAAVKIGFGYGVYWLLMFCSAAFGFWYGGYYLRQKLEAGCTSLTDDPDKPKCATAGDLIGTFINVLISAFFVGKVLPWFSDLHAANIAVRETVALYSRVTAIDPFSEEGITDFSEVKGEIVIKDVAFSYPTREVPVFRSLNLTIPAGRSIALVGASGCGKSTVVQFILRFYNPDSGTITLDGIPLDQYNTMCLREHIAWVSQEPKLFASSIADNIRIGKPDATLDEIISVCKQANAHDFINSLPEKYDTWVGEGGGQLSGGQKQRVAIARALIKTPKILILDEATSALDNASEKMVQETIDQIVQATSITTIIIAHRLSTVRQADCIAVLNQTPEGGAIVAELGTHQQLSAIPHGIYAALVAVQSGGAVHEETEEERQLFAHGLQSQLTYEEETMVKRRSSSRKSMRKDSTDRLVVKEGGLIRLGSRDGPGNNARMDPALAAPICKMDSLVFNPSYAPPRLFRRTAQPLQRSLWRFLLGLLSSVVFNCVWPIFGISLSDFISTYVKYDKPSDVTAHSLANSGKMIGIGGGAFIAFWLMKTFSTSAGQKIVSRMRTEGYDSMVYQETGFFDQSHRSPARLAGILTADAGLLGEWVAGNLATWIGTGVSLTLGFIICMVANAKLGGVALAILAVLVPAAYIGSTLVTSGGSLKFWQGGEDSLARLNRELGIQVTDAVLNIRTITAYNMQEQAEKDFRERSNEIFMIGRRRAWLAGFVTGIINTCRIGSFTLLFYYGATLIQNKEIDPVKMIRGSMALLLAALQTGRTLAGTVPWALGLDAARSVWTVIDREPTIDERITAEGDQCRKIDEVKFEHVAFKYPTRPNLIIFRDVSFDIPRGKSIALVGASGCGKSTSVQLVERFYDVFEGLRGAVLFNGIDIRQYNLHSVRSKIGYVPQEPKLFAGSIRENILYGWPSATEADIIEACEKANAWGFIQDQPNGLDTDVGRGGMRLSGGQKQRIAIARALVRKPDLLILDEATSALDAESEKIVQSALNKLLENKQFTTLVIAHRLSTIRDCDSIVVFVNDAARGSHVAEIGTHNELLQIPDGVYKSLVRIAEGH